MKPSGIGGQAVMEGVMMKNQSEYAVAVRKPDNEIVVEKKKCKGLGDQYRFFRLPVIRGIVAFVESLWLGMSTLTYSASFFEDEEEEKESRFEKALGKVFKDKAEDVIMGFVVVLSMLLAVGFFMLLPYFAASFLEHKIASRTALAIIEGVIRLVIFVGYLLLISRMEDIKRVFMYHGAEHMTINCVENLLPLTVDNVRKQSKEHKRCGTSFMLYVLIISIIFFAFIRVETAWMRFALRVALVPIVAGVAYEFIRFAGRSNSKVIAFLSRPGLWLQGLTTKEPDDSMIEVAIASVEAVFNWEQFIEENSPKQEKTRGKRTGKRTKKRAARAGEKPETKPAANLEDEVKGKPETKAGDKASTKAEVKTNVTSESKARTKAESKTSTKSEGKAGEKVESKANAKAESKADTKAEGKASIKAESKPSTKAEGKASTKAESKPSTKPEGKSTAKPETESEAKSDNSAKSVKSATVKPVMKAARRKRMPMVERTYIQDYESPEQDEEEDAILSALDKYFNGKEED